MHRHGRVTASIENSKEYLILLVHRLMKMYIETGASGIEVESGYRDTLETNLFAVTSNAIQKAFCKLQNLLLKEYQVVLKAVRHSRRLYLTIEQKNPAL
ncbi:MAG: hypothetical protein VXY83_04170 [Pseudomonadota bacterium]|nr:hypothetical protein [Pseudomonadota bacterium]